MLSRCSYSVVDAIHHFETGEGPVDLFEIPRFRVPNSEPGISARQGVTRWQLDLREMEP